MNFNALAGRGIGDRQQTGAANSLQTATRFAALQRPAQKAGDIFRRGGWS